MKKYEQSRPGRTSSSQGTPSKMHATFPWGFVYPNHLSQYTPMLCHSRENPTIRAMHPPTHHPSRCGPAMANDRAKTTKKPRQTSALNLLKSTHILQRGRQPLILLQQVKHLAELQVGRVLQLHEALDRRADQGVFPGREDGG